MKVTEIFNSIEGEGKRAGLPATFIRLHGCNLRCSYCDSMYAVDGKDWKEMSINEIVEKVKKIGCTNITLTGGEPLIHENINELIKALIRENCSINVETNGTVKPSIRGTHIFYTVDYKTTSSEMLSRMDPKIFRSLYQTDVIKFVVGSQEDLDDALYFMDSLEDVPAQVYVSPVFGKIEPLDIVHYIQVHKLWNWHLQIQLHKLLWAPDKRGV